MSRLMCAFHTMSCFYFKKSFPPGRMSSGEASSSSALAVNWQAIIFLFPVTANKRRDEQFFAKQPQKCCSEKMLYIPNMISIWKLFTWYLLSTRLHHLWSFSIRCENLSCWPAIHHNVWGTGKIFYSISGQWRQRPSAFWQIVYHGSKSKEKAKVESS